MGRNGFALFSLTAALAMLPSAALCAGDFDPFEGPKPLIVFMRTNPWAEVIGADVPQCVVYEGGEIVYLKDRNFRRHQLSQSELAGLKERVAALAAVKDLKTFYNRHPGISDQPESCFYLATSKNPFTVSVYGLVDSDQIQAPAASPGGQRRQPDALPAELVQLHKQFVNLDFKESRPWSPKYVELMLWPYDYAKEPFVQWPPGWPGLASDRAIKRGDSYSIFFDGALLPKLAEFLGKMHTRAGDSAVKLDGKKWSASARLTFPSEPVWSKAFQGI